jgi:hypothetical protein
MVSCGVMRFRKDRTDQFHEVGGVLGLVKLFDDVPHVDAAGLRLGA